MSINTFVPNGYNDELLVDISPIQQLLGPQRARIVVHDEPDVSPIDLELRVALSGGRYRVTELSLIASRVADVEDDFVRATRVPSDDDRYTPASDGPGISPTALQEIRIPPILTRALASTVKPRRLLSTNEWVTGMTEEDIVPTTYMLAQIVGAPPTQAVAERLGISSGAAAQRVKRARDAGLIEPTTKGAR